MGETPCDLTPGGLALRLQQARHVVENDDEAAAAVFALRQRHAGDDQHFDTPCDTDGLQFELFAPFLSTR